MFIRQYYCFRKSYSGNLTFNPQLHDFTQQGGVARGEYFIQDLHIARKIHQANPELHVDIGSRFDGFVAHIASFRDIYVFDIRNVSINIPGIYFYQIDMMGELPNKFFNFCDSISCLHALEHFGLGRYGDSIDRDGHKVGLSNISKILKKNGVFYLLVPIGAPRVEFNGQRVLDLQEIISLAKEEGLILEEFSYLADDENLINCDINQFDFGYFSNKHYFLGIMLFRKL